MFNYGWPANTVIVLSILSMMMLAVLLFSALQIKPSKEVEVLKYFDGQFLEKAAAYNRISLLVSIAERFIYWTVMFCAVILLWKNLLINKKINFILAFFIFAAFLTIIYIVLLPLQYYRGFVLEHRFGLSNQGFGAWLGDVAKERAISLFIYALVMTVLYILIIYLPKNWWLAAAAIFIIFIIAANFLFPVLIDPLFYKFTPLDNKNLENKIFAMADKENIKIESMLVADASKKTNRINAYFTGIGKTKRIVIYDNLINKNTEEEVLAVIAHEMGHYKYRHIFISMLIGSASVALVLFILRLMQAHLNVSASVRLVLAMFIVFSFVSYIIMPLQNFISRQFEKQADRTAVELTADPKTAILVFKKLANTNLSNVNPPPPIKYIIYSHPPIIERIKSAETYLSN
ncbi:MAG: M48 family metallopeptidase [Actinobacteria bacterium]|nr:M48 family metallopeptidase [Actinomycetota bacterium]